MPAKRRGHIGVLVVSVGVLLTGCLAGWQPEAAFPELTTLADITCVDDETCWSVGAEGTGAAIVATTDGETWARQTAGVTGDGLEGIACATATTCVAVGGGTILTTVTAGTTWVSRLDEADLDLRAVACTDAQHCIAVGGKGDAPAVRVTADAGLTWTSATTGLPSAGAVNDIACAPNGPCLTAGPVQHMLFSGDAGATWADRPVMQWTPPPPDWPYWGGPSDMKSVTCLANGTCTAVGQGVGRWGAFAAISRSTDWGTTWTSQGAAGASNDLRAVECADAQHCWAGSVASGQGSIIATNLGGEGWGSWYGQLSGIDGAQTANAFECLDVNRCLVVLSTTGGPVIKSTPNGGVNVPVISRVSPNSGSPAGGTTLTITGRGFDETTEVLIGGKSAAIVSKDLNQLVVTTPPADPGVTLVDIVVKTPDLQTATDNVNGLNSTGTTSFSYTPTPTITSVSFDRCWADEGWRCDGVQVTGTGFVPGSWGEGSTPATTFKLGGVAGPGAYCPTSTECGVNLPRLADHPELLNRVLDFSVTTAGGTGSVPFTVGPLVAAANPTSGPPTGGTTVTITGQGLDAVTAVEFAGVPATSFTTVSSTEVRAVTPAGTADSWATISVTTVLGEFELWDGWSGFRFGYSAPPTITAIHPTQGGPGTYVEVQGTGLTTVQQPTIYFGTVPGIDGWCNGEGACGAYAPEGVAPGTVAITIETGAGRSPVNPAATFEYLPLATVTAVTPLSAPVAGGTTVTLTGTNLDQVGSVDLASFGAQIVSQTPTQLVVLTPPVYEPTSGEIWVWSAAGPVNTGITFTYT